MRLGLNAWLPLLAAALLLVTPGSAQMPEKISDNLFVYRDTCNVYVVKSGDEAILIDFGSGGVLEHLAEIGVNKVSWVLHTHYHRDQCQGDDALAGLGIKVAVPADQRRYFEDAEGAWKHMQLYHNYSFKPDFFEPTRSIKVDEGITPGETFEWGGLRFETLPSVGHTKDPGLTCLAEVDGKKVAFTGDLIHSPGKLWTYYDLQWRYNQHQGAQAGIESLEAVKNAKPDLLLPSHGVVMDNPQEAIDQTVAHIREVVDLLRWQPAHDQSKRNQQIFPHVVHQRTSFIIVADDGHALFYDSSIPEPEVEQLVRDHGIKQIDMIILSHYHDDHVGGIPTLKEKYGAELWAHESMVDIIETPYRYNIPCLGVGRYPDEAGPKVDRVLNDGDTFEWEGWTFKVFHFPGQTEYHMGMYAEIDGHRMVFMGDSTYRPQPGTIFRGENFNCRNYCRLGEGAGYLGCGEILKEYNPDMAMAAHFGAIPLDEGRIDEYYQWAKKLEPTFAKVVARSDPNFGTDPNWVSFYPYRVFAEAGETVVTEVRIRNHSDHQAEAVVRPLLPAGWRSNPEERRITIAAKETGGADFRIVLSKDAPISLRTVITANVVFDGIDYGEFPEMIIDNRSEKDKWREWYLEKAKAARISPSR